MMASTFGVLVAALGNSPATARGVTTLAVLMMVMLGGAWVPTFIFPAWLQQFTLIVPFAGRSTASTHDLARHRPVRCGGADRGLLIFAMASRWWLRSDSGGRRVAKEIDARSAPILSLRVSSWFCLRLGA
jgi:ABC-2 type transport system permease protein